MRTIFFLLFTLYTTIAHSQQIVTNEEPGVFRDIPNNLFVGVWNPITISTGKFRNVKVKIRDGKIKPADGLGKYLVLPWPDSVYTGHTTIILSAGGKEHVFDFQNISLPYPKADVSGPRGEHNMIWNFKLTTGVVAYIRQSCFYVDYRVDSFSITFSDSISVKTHINTGSTWDSTTKEWLRLASYGTIITIKDVFVKEPDPFPLQSSGEYDWKPGGQFCLKDQLIYSIR